MLNLGGRGDQRDQVGKLGAEFLGMVVLDLKKEISFGFLRDTPEPVLVSVNQ